MRKKIHIVFLDRATFPKGIKMVKPKIPHVWTEYDYSTPSQVEKRCQRAQVIITNKVVITSESIKKLPHLELISVTATGTNNIDKDACKKYNISLKNVIDYGTDSVAEHTWCLILNLFRQFLPYRESILKNHWTRSKNFSYFLESVREVAGSRLAIIGSGVLGCRVGELASAFKMDTVYVSNPNSKSHKKYKGLKFVSLNEALKTSDVISIHCPLTPKSKNMITLKEMKKMKATSFIVNTSRGGVVNEEDLDQALRQNLIGGAAFDVLSIEPPPASHILHRLRFHPHFILTPHIAWIGENSINNLLNMAIAHIDNFYNTRKTKSI